ncbi:MAG: rod shape-determining protein MreC, partial [Pseudomonadota bacterium]
GVDGVYPAGLPVARVDKVERRVDSGFARISCQALAQVNGVEHVLVLAPLQPVVPAPVEPATGPTPARQGGRN